MVATTGEKLMKIETQIEDIKATMQNDCKRNEDNFDKVFRKLDALGNSFAGKWVEKVVVGGALLLITIILALAQLVI